MDPHRIDPTEEEGVAQVPEAILEEMEGNKRTLTGWQNYLVCGIALAASLFHLYTAYFGQLSAMYQRGWHWLFMGTILFLRYPLNRRRPRGSIDLWDWALAGLLAAGCINILLNWDAIALREGAPLPSDIWMGVLMILLVLDGARRSMGWPLPLMAMVAIVYALFGPYFPGLLGHAGFPVSELAPFLYLRTDGIFGVPLGVSASFIFLFVLFGSFLSISGAIVAAASTGGQVMPPVMGAAAFVMAQFLGVSYWSIVVAAAVPATLYFISIMAMVHFRAGRKRMTRLSAEELPRARSVLREGWHLLLPIVVLVVFLALGYSPTKAVFWSIVLLVVVSWFGKPQHRMTPPLILRALVEGGLGAVEVAAACACSGIVIGVIGLTGIGLLFSSFVLSLSGGILPFALILTMIGSIILGMGVPTTAQYIITSTLAAPALFQMGVPMMSAHLFCLYFGVLADVTPPVALATYAASGIARSNPLKTGFTALLQAAAGFVVPFMFVYNSYLLLQGDLFHILLGCGTALVGILGLSAAIQGYLLDDLNPLLRALLLGVPFLTIHPSLISNVAAAGLVAGIYAWQRLRVKKAGESVAKQEAVEVDPCKDGSR